MEVFPPLFKDFYTVVAPGLKWACFFTDLSSVLFLFCVMHINRKTISPYMRVCIIFLMIHIGSRLGAITLQADLFITPFTLMGSIGLAGASALSALGITGLRPDSRPAVTMNIVVKESVE